jgi:hypothetical protein
VRDRVRAARPDSSPEEVEAVVAWAEAVQARAYDLTAPGWPSGQGTDEQFKAITRQAADQLRAEYPEIPPATLSHAISQAHYWHFRD